MQKFLNYSSTVDLNKYNCFSCIKMINIYHTKYLQK